MRNFSNNNACSPKKQTSLTNLALHNRQLTFQIFSCWLFQVHWLEQLLNGAHKSFHIFYYFLLPQTTIFIYCIKCNSMCKHANGNNTFLREKGPIFMNASLHCMKYPSCVTTTSTNVTFDNDIKITNHIH